LIGETMKRNVDKTEAILRIILGVLLIMIVFVGPKTSWGWLGLFFLATSILRYCP